MCLGSYQVSHQTPTGEVALQKHDQISLRYNEATAEDDDSSRRSHCLIESVEARRR